MALSYIIAVLFMLRGETEFKQKRVSLNAYVAGENQELRNEMRITVFSKWLKPVLNMARCTLVGVEL